MKSIHANIRVGLICALTVLFLNCKKEKVDPIPPSVWNYSTFTDVRDGKAYKSIKIGNQEWMAENLAYSVSGSWAYWNDEKYGIQYGRLYTWDAAKLAVPAGWHLPTDAEWKILEMSLGMNQSDADLTGLRGINQGDKLKSMSGWPENENGTNEVGFTALPGGFRSNPGIFLNLSGGGFWWCDSENDNSQAWFRIIVTADSKVGRGLGFKGEGYSVRCVKN